MFKSIITYLDKTTKAVKFSVCKNAKKIMIATVYYGFRAISAVNSVIIKALKWLGLSEVNAIRAKKAIKAIALVGFITASVFLFFGIIAHAHAIMFAAYAAVVVFSFIYICTEAE